MYICRDKTQMNISQVKENLRLGMKQNFYVGGREWPYRDVPRKIIAEKFLEDSDTNELRDYKFFCFNGVVKFFKIDFDRFINHRANYYSRAGELLPFGEIVCPPLANKVLRMPSQLETMVLLAERLSKNIPFLRVDFYEVNNKLYFGELTFFPDSGFGKWTDESVDYELGQMISLPSKNMV